MGMGAVEGVWTMPQPTNDLLMYVGDEGAQSEDVADVIREYTGLRFGQRDIDRWLARAELGGLVDREIIGDDLQLWSLTSKGERMSRMAGSSALRRRLIRLASSSERGSGLRRGLLELLG
jgi:hypothetical protein